MTSFGFVKAFDLDPGDSGDGSDDDTTAPYITITPTKDIVCHTIYVVGKATDFGSGVKNVKLYIDNAYIKTSTSSTCSYSWDTSGYSDKSIHKIKIVAEDNAGNVRSSTKSYIIGYTEDTQHYSNPFGYSGGIETDLGTIAYTKIETDLFGLILLVEGHSVNNYLGDDLFVCHIDVTTVYYCKDDQRLGYNLDPSERPIETPDGTLVELNFEMEETNTGLADESVGVVRDTWADDRLMCPNFGTPNDATPSDRYEYIISKSISTIVSFIPKIPKWAGFAINLAKDFVLSKVKIGDDDIQTTGVIGADPVHIDYKNLSPNGQNVLYPENNYNYAYDGISRHRIQYEYRQDSALNGETIGIKFRCNAQFKDSRTTVVDVLFSDWVKFEVILN